MDHKLPPHYQKQQPAHKQSHQPATIQLEIQIQPVQPLKNNKQTNGQQHSLQNQLRLTKQQHLRASATSPDPSDEKLNHVTAANLQRDQTSQKKGLAWQHPVEEEVLCTEQELLYGENYNMTKPQNGLTCKLHDTIYVCTYTHCVRVLITALQCK